MNLAAITSLSTYSVIIWTELNEIAETIQVANETE